MRDLIVTENITLDGVIDAAEGWFAPGGDDGEVDQSDLEAATREHFEAADGFLAGRVTFEQMRGYWPEQAGDTTGIRDYLNEVSKYVVSGTLDDPGEHSTVLSGPPRDEIEALRPPGQGHRDPGSTARARPDRGRAGDEYRFPVRAGTGRVRSVTSRCGAETLRRICAGTGAPTGRAGRRREAARLGRSSTSSGALHPARRGREREAPTGNHTVRYNPTQPRRWPRPRAERPGRPTPRCGSPAGCGAA